MFRVQAQRTIGVGRNVHGPSNLAQVLGIYTYTPATAGYYRYIIVIITWVLHMSSLFHCLKLFFSILIYCSCKKYVNVVIFLSIVIMSIWIFMWNASQFRSIFRMVNFYIASINAIILPCPKLTFIQNTYTHAPKNNLRFYVCIVHVLLCCKKTHGKGFRNL